MKDDFKLEKKTIATGTLADIIKNESVVCANTLCRKLIINPKDRVMIGRYAYCKECSASKKGV